MSVYLDANIIVALFVPDALTTRSIALVSSLSDSIIVSDLTALEFSGVAAKLVRTRELSPKAAREAFTAFDVWAASQGRTEIQPTDVVVADRFVRRLDINLHGGDALHVAMAMRAGAALLTLDAKMRANAKKAGLAVI